MNIKEIGTTIRREITDAIKGIDSNPSHIAAFPAHTDACPRTAPIKFTFAYKAHPAMWNSWIEAIPLAATCTECKGSVALKK